MNRELKLELERCVPVAALESFLEAHTAGEKIKHKNKAETISKISEIVLGRAHLQEKLELLLGQYHSAGRGALKWGAFDQELSSQTLETLLVQNYGEQLFQDGIRPEVKQKPSLHKARWVDAENQILRLDFVESGKRRLEYQNYELQESTPMKMIHSLVRFTQDKAIVEIRASQNYTLKYQNEIGDILGGKVKDISFTIDEINEIEQRLATSRRSAKHKKLGGDIDTVSVIASPKIEDLKASKEYNRMLGKDDIKDARCNFSYKQKDGRLIKVSMGISNKGSIWFMSDIPEEVIEHVFSVVKLVKGL